MLAAFAKGRAGQPALIFAICAGVYVATLAGRVNGTSDNPHFVHLADSYLHGQLSLVADKPPGNNDWAHYGDRWYESFPPLPALVILPAVAIWGKGVWDRLFWALFAGLGPALLFVLLRRLREDGRSERSLREDLALTGLFAFGSVYYYVSVQGTVWYAAHVVSCALIPLYLLMALGARRPVLAGVVLALCFMTRPSTVLLGAFFAVEALDAARGNAGASSDEGLTRLARVRRFFAAVQWSRAAGSVARFAAPLLVVGLIAMWMNQARFDDPFEFGHSHLKIRWRSRIDTWGLFNYHYLSRNLSIFLASMPWLSGHAPYLQISRHGLALWVTTPHLLLVLWPRRVTATMVGLAMGAALVALLDLSYQNSGWIQFGHRFSLDYAMALFALLALGGRRFGRPFYGMMIVAFAVNLFGAVTFDRIERFYDDDATQRRIFQPD